MVNLHQDDTKNGDLEKLVSDNNELAPLIDVYPSELRQRLIDNKDKLARLCKKFGGPMHSVTKNVVVMQCNIDKCPYSSVCVLNKEELAPEGCACPIELKISNELEYSLIESLDIDKNDVVEMEQVYDYIDAKILDMRTSGLLSKGSLIQDIKSIGEGRAHITSKDVSPEFKIKLDLKKLKSQILDEFMATRKSKKKYGINQSMTYDKIIEQAMLRDKNK